MIVERIGKNPNRNAKPLQGICQKKISEKAEHRSWGVREGRRGPLHKNYDEEQYEKTSGILVNRDRELRIKKGLTRRKSPAFRVLA